MGHVEFRREKALHQAGQRLWKNPYLAYTDHEIGRVIQAVEDMGQLDDTLIIYISGDNGASPEGTSTELPTSSPSSTARPSP